MIGADHYREAEADLDAAWDRDTADSRRLFLVATAQVHATLALAAATIEAADHDQRAHRLIGRPTPAQHGDPAWPGTPWGRAFYGDRHLEGGDQS